MPKKYKYYIGSTEVFPLDDKSLKIIYDKTTPSSVYLEKKLSASVSFKSTGEFNFKTQEAQDPTEELDFIIKEFCGGVYADFIKLKFTVGEGEFDNDNCIFSVNTKSVNDFRKDIKVNIIIKQNLINGGLLGQGIYFENTLCPSDFAQFKQAFYFDKTILSVAQASNSKISGIISDFFQINPINVSSDALPGVPNKWMNMAFSALSDIQNPVPSDLARVEFITFQELMDDLNTLFDVFWFIDTSNNLRIEHRIFFEGILGLDLTDSRYARYLLGTNKYKYDLEDYPRTETLKITNSKQYAQLTNGYFATINNNKKELVKDTRKINTDFTNIWYFDGGSTADGLFLFACDGTTASTAFQMVDDISSEDLFNGTLLTWYGQNVYLTPHYLMHKLHRYGRYDSGSFFESLTVFSPGTCGVPEYWQNGQIRAGGIKHTTVRPNILQNKISVPLCCDDVFEADKKIQTALGEGVVNKAKLDLNNEMLELELKYPAPEYNFTPLSVDGLELWLRGDSGIQLGGMSNFYVTQWDDSSGNGRHAVPDTGTEPFNGIVTPYGVRFGIASAVKRYLRVPGFQLFPSKRGTIFVMYYMDFDLVGGRNSSLISTNDAAPATNFFDISLDDDVLYSTNQSTNNLLPQNFFTNRRLYQYKRIENDKVICKDNSRDIPAYQNPTIAASPFDVYNPTTIDNILYTIKDIIIGENPQFSGGTCTPTILEVIIYDTALSDVDCERVELYLAKKGYYLPGTQILEDF